MEFIVSDCEDLKCGLCSNYLSYFPINITKDGLNICGRCEIPLENNEVVPHAHNKVYEILAKCLKFSCRYANEGCTEKLLSKDVPGHEALCPLRLINCPASLLDLCDLEVSVPEINNHCKEVHSDLILKDRRFEIDLATSTKYNNIVFTDDECFVIIGNYDSETTILNYTLYHAQFTENVHFESYKLSLKNEYTSVVRSFFTCRAQLGICGDIHVRLNFFEFPNKDVTISAELLLEDIKENSTPAKPPITKTVEELFECSVCGKLIRPPVEIYLHDEKVLCGNCINRNNMRYTYIKNHIFNKLAESLFYQCQNNSNGCDYKSHPRMLEKHEIVCPFQVVPCVLNCEWKGMIRDIPPHIDKNHSKNFVTSPEFKVKILSDGEYFDLTKLYLIKANGYVFRIYFSGSRTFYYWSVQMVGGFQNGFKYNIEIYDKLGRQQSCTKMCTPLKDLKLLLLNNDDYCYFTLDQLEKLLGTKYMRFRVRIFE